MEVELGSDPICGSLSVPGGGAWAFVGWIALVTALDEAMRAAAPTGDEQAWPRGVT